ncbi:MarR family winged helix-turn-helix transcriptional regulator [Rhizobium binxianense]
MNAFEEKFKNEEFLLYLLPSVARKMSRTCDAVYAEFGLKITEWRLLAQISRFGSISAKEISERIAMDQVSISRAAHSCVKRGLIEEIPDAVDRRSKKLVLSKDGEAFMNRFLPRACTLAEAMESGLSAHEVATLKTLLTKLDGHLKSMSQFSAADTAA